MANAAERRKAIADLQAKRGGRLCVSYVTSTRPGHEIQIADDVLRLLYEHLEAGKAAAETGVDLFIHSNGGSGTVPWRIVSLIREYTKSFAVLVPHHAFSAATLIALGADEIVMHRMGCLGPIDPSVANVFNPPNPLSPGQPAPISVEDVSSYFKMIKEQLGITHEDELIQAVLALTEKIHPLALGNVQRSHSQARMMATKLLKQHMNGPNHDHEITRIIDTLKSNLFYHGHPINRGEAMNDLKLKVVFPPDEVERAMWNLYLMYESELKLTEALNPVHEIEKAVAATPPAVAPPTTQELVQQLLQLAQNGVAMPAMPPAQLVDLAAAMLPHLRGAIGNTLAKVKLEGVPGVVIESSSRTDTLKTDLRFERTTVTTPAGPQEGMKQEVIWQRWEEET